MYIYADILFLINLAINNVILITTGYMTGRPYRWGRVMVAAALGAIYVFGELSLNIAPLVIFSGRLGISIVMVTLAFGFNSGREMLTLMGTFYFITFLFGGAVAGWAYLGETGSLEAVKLFNPLPWQLLIGGVVVGLSLVVLLLKLLVGRVQRRQLIYKIDIEFQGRSVRLDALLDTGNALYSIGAGRPVILAGLDDIKAVLSTAVYEFLKENRPECWLINLAKCRDEAWLERVSLTAFKSVGKDGMLLGFRPDRLQIFTTAGKVSAADIVVGITGESLASDGSYAALLHPAVIKGDNKKRETGICA